MSFCVLTLHSVALLNIPQIPTHHQFLFSTLKLRPHSRWFMWWVRLQCNDGEANFVRRRDSAIGFEWETDMSTAEENVGANVCVRHPQPEGEGSEWHVGQPNCLNCLWGNTQLMTLGKGVVRALVCLNRSVLYKMLNSWITCWTSAFYSSEVTLNHHSAAASCVYTTYVTSG